MSLPNLSAEEERLHTLTKLSLEQTATDREFDEIIEMASRACDAPIALITLVGAEFQWHKARKGMQEHQLDRSASFCAHALHQKELFVVNDTLLDDRFCNNPLVTSGPQVRFYAGSPITAPNGQPLGALCVLDRKPRELSWQQAGTLKMLAGQVNRLIELHNQNNTVAGLHQQLQAGNEQAEQLKSKQAEVAELIAGHSAAISDFATQQLEPLRTGKFTKKDLALIYSRGQRLASRMEQLSQALALLSKSPDRNHILPASEVITPVLEAAAPAFKEKSIVVTPQLADDLPIGHGEVVALALRILMQNLLRHYEKTAWHLIGLHKGSTTELHLSVLHRSKIDEAAHEPGTLRFPDFPVADKLMSHIGGSFTNAPYQQGRFLTLVIPLA